MKKEREETMSVVYAVNLEVYPSATQEIYKGHILIVIDGVPKNSMMSEQQIKAGVLKQFSKELQSTTYINVFKNKDSQYPMLVNVKAADAIKIISVEQYC